MIDIFEITEYPYSLKPSHRSDTSLANKSPLKMMKNVFYYILKTPFFLKIFKILSRLFWSCRKTATKKAKGKFKIYNAIN